MQNSNHYNKLYSLNSNTGFIFRVLFPYEHFCVEDGYMPRSLWWYTDKNDKKTLYYTNKWWLCTEVLHTECNAGDPYPHGKQLQYILSSF